MKLRATVLVLALGLALPALADEAADRRAEDEEFVQKLLAIIEKTIEQSEDTALDRTSTTDVNGRDREAYEELTRRLDNQRVTLNFDGTAFLEAVDFFRDVTGLNIIVSKKAQELVEGASPVKLKLKDVKIRNALELLLTQTDAQLRYGFRHGVLEIGTKDDWKGKNVVIELIPVEDLIYRPPDFPAPEAGIDYLAKQKLSGRGR